MINEELKIKALLAQGERPSDIAKRVDVKASYSTIVKYRTQLREDAEKAQVEEIIAIDPVALKLMAEKVALEAPLDLEFEKPVQQIVRGAIGLQALEAEFQYTMKTLLTKATVMAGDESMSPTGLKVLMDGVTGMYNSAFNSKSTTINMNQSNVSAEGLNAFKAVQR